MSIYIIIMVIYSKDTVMVQIVMLEILINENTLKCRTLATYWTVIWA